MEQLFLEDLKSMTEVEIKAHIVNEYAGEKSGFDYGEPDDNDKAEVERRLKSYDIIIAYESVGSWGCDSSSYFLIQNKKTGQYKEFSGSHCSCYGFEGQFDPQGAPLNYLKSDKFSFYTGGYDDNAPENEKVVKAFVSEL